MGGNGLRIAAMLMTIALSEACAGPEEDGRGPGAAAWGKQVEDAAALADTLRALGLQVEPAGTIRQPFFESLAQVLKMGEHQIQVFRFSDSTTAAAATARVSPDGGTVGTTAVTWVSTPHFYRRGRIVVLYVGEDNSIRAALRTVLGPPFAGG